jgi:hypothetical protein
VCSNRILVTANIGENVRIHSARGASDTHDAGFFRESIFPSQNFPPLQNQLRYCPAWQKRKIKTKPTPNGGVAMKRSTKALFAGAAMAGLMTGAVARTYASQQTTTQSGTSLSNGWGQMDDSGDKGKHDCKGQNSCKGTGGCKGSDNGCKGQNSCKGKGGCKSSTPAPTP